MVIFLSAVLVALATVFFYLSCPNQQWTQRKPLSFTFGTSIALVLCVGAGIILSQQFSTISSVFTVVTLAMLLMSIFPLFTRLTTPTTNTKKVKPTLTRDELYKTHRSQWVLKTTGAVILSFPLAVMFMGIIGVLLSNSVVLDVRSQLVMWFIVPLWLLPLSLIYLSKAPLRLFAVLGLLNIATYFILAHLNSGL
ncbi:MAG: hypothetical protein VYD53_07330 [Pseudomonadota bacterium]|nr:hypothetical protein [Pseudomonadota bacterium]